MFGDVLGAGIPPSRGRGDGVGHHDGSPFPLAPPTAVTAAAATAATAATAASPILNRGPRVRSGVAAEPVSMAQRNVRNRLRSDAFGLGDWVSVQNYYMCNYSDNELLRLGGVPFDDIMAMLQ